MHLPEEKLFAIRLECGSNSNLETKQMLDRVLHAGVKERKVQ